MMPEQNKGHADAWVSSDHIMGRLSLLLRSKQTILLLLTFVKVAKPG